MQFDGKIECYDRQTDRQTERQSSKSSQKLLEDEDTQLAIISEATNNDRDQSQIAINPNQILIQVHDQYNKISTHHAETTNERHDYG